MTCTGASAWGWSVWPTAMAGDGTLSGRLAGVPAADAYVAELGCTTE